VSCIRHVGRLSLAVWLTWTPEVGSIEVRAAAVGHSPASTARQLRDSARQLRAVPSGSQRLRETAALNRNPASVAAIQRRGRDLNPRRACTLNGFRDRPVRPLRHPSSGEGGIRTLEGGYYPPNALAGRRLQPLGHFSVQCRIASGPAKLARTLMVGIASDALEGAAFSHSATRPIRIPAFEAAPLPSKCDARLEGSKTGAAMPGYVRGEPASHVLQR
jgi:hypothetical protein